MCPRERKTASPPKNIFALLQIASLPPRRPLESIRARCPKGSVPNTHWIHPPLQSPVHRRHCQTLPQLRPRSRFSAGPSCDFSPSQASSITADLRKNRQQRKIGPIPHPFHQDVDCHRRVLRRRHYASSDVKRTRAAHTTLSDSSSLCEKRQRPTSVDTRVFSFLSVVSSPSSRLSLGTRDHPAFLPYSDHRSETFPAQLAPFVLAPFRRRRKEEETERS
jgi:hypothetical protein